jgi:deoxyadenosine/deoxycytidine kinase
MVRIISIEGNIGSGKSTFFTSLKKHYETNTSIKFCDEPVNEWLNIKDENEKTILECFYENQIKYSFHFQMVAYISRLNILREMLKKDVEIIFTERCVHTDMNVFAQMLFDAGKMSNIEFTIYKKWFDEFLEEIPPIFYVYIDTTANMCYNRIIERGRSGESIPLDYLVDCKKYHDNWLLNNNQVLILNGNVEKAHHKYWVEVMDGVIDRLIKL